MWSVRLGHPTNSPPDIIAGAVISEYILAGVLTRFQSTLPLDVTQILKLVAFKVVVCQVLPAVKTWNIPASLYVRVNLFWLTCNMHFSNHCWPILVYCISIGVLSKSQQAHCLHTKLCQHLTNSAIMQIPRIKCTNLVGHLCIKVSSYHLLNLLIRVTRFGILKTGNANFCSVLHYHCHFLPRVVKILLEIFLNSKIIGHCSITIWSEETIVLHMHRGFYYYCQGKVFIDIYREKLVLHCKKSQHQLIRLMSLLLSRNQFSASDNKSYYASNTFWLHSTLITTFGFPRFYTVNWVA